MKNLTILLVLLLTTIVTLNLQAQGCTPGLAVTELEANNISVTLPQGGSLFWNGNGDAGYGFSETSTISSGVKTIFAGGLWMGGYDGSVLKIAASEYGLSDGSTDYWPGPLNDFGGTTATDCANWDRLFETSENDISSFLADWSDGTLDDPIPTSLLGWPGRSNPHFMDLFGFDFPNINYELAPFEDMNFDGIYDPNDGDYPAIKGAAKATFWVFNDAGNVHTHTNSDPLRVEIHGLAYAYASSNEAINNSTFYDMKIVNKSISTLTDTYVGLWIDPDLGCFTDDYIGTDPTNDLVYIYNEDALDGITGCACPAGVATFCEEIPMLGIKMLNGILAPKVFGANGELLDPAPNQNADTLVEIKLSSVIYYNNGGLQPAPPAGTDDPSFDFEYYNYLSGKFKDGTPLTTGGDGYDPASTNVTNFAFPDSPDDPNGWSMCAENLGTQDRRIVMGVGPFRMDPGSINKLSFAVVHVPDVPHPCPSVEPLTDAVGIIEDLYYGTISSTKETLDKSINVTVMPNPFTTETKLEFPELENQIQGLQLYNISGQLVREYSEISGRSLTIKRDELQSGMYFYKVKTNDQRYLSGKLIVQ